MIISLLSNEKNMEKIQELLSSLPDLKEFMQTKSLIRSIKFLKICPEFENEEPPMGEIECSYLFNKEYKLEMSSHAVVRYDEFKKKFSYDNTLKLSSHF